MLRTISYFIAGCFCCAAMPDTSHSLYLMGAFVMFGLGDDLK